MQLKVLLKTTRPQFLILTPVCVFLGLSTSLAAQSQINIFIAFLVLIGALCAHVSVNTLNEYLDFKSGLDLETERTPFSGGSGALPDNPGMAGATLVVGLVSLIVTVVIGFYLVLTRGSQIIPFGIVGVLLIITYTQWLNRSPFLCLIAPGLGFGILMVVGTHVVLTGGYSQLAWLVSLVPFFLFNNLLLLNQYPDMKADSSVGRNTFPIAFGINNSNAVYAIFTMATCSLIVIYIVKGFIPNIGAIALIPLAFSLFTLVGAMSYATEIGEYPRFMGANVVAALLTPLLLGISIVTSELAH
jgi:1,4-dihydroxy-2-naphthoate octaprenyltransferase